jgi:hypothetical protein
MSRDLDLLALHSNKFNFVSQAELPHHIYTCDISIEYLFFEINGSMLQFSFKGQSNNKLHIFRLSSDPSLPHVSFSDIILYPLPAL